MACWQDNHSFDDRKTKGMEMKTLRYEDGKQKCFLAPFLRPHLPGLGMRMMVASSNFSIGDTTSNINAHI